MPSVPHLPKGDVPGDGVPALLLDPVQVEEGVPRVPGVLKQLEIFNGSVAIFSMILNGIDIRG